MSSEQLSLEPCRCRSAPRTVDVTTSNGYDVVNLVCQHCGQQLVADRGSN